MWGESAGTPYYVVECKGTQSNSSASMNQLRRGLEQVPSLVFGTGARTVTTLVVATCMEEYSTTVYVLDPPPDQADDHEKPEGHERVSDRTDEGTWRILNVEAFESRTQLARESELLKWAGQFNSAAVLDNRLGRIERVPQVPNLELQKKQTELGVFAGISQPLFPELGVKSLRVFSGVEAELITKIMRSDPTARHAAKAIHDHVAMGRHQLEGAPRRLSPFVSVSRNGTCMIIEGLG